MLGRYYSDCLQSDYDLAGNYVDESGQRGVKFEERPAGRAICHRVHCGDILLMTSLDRAACRIKDGLSLLRWFMKAGVGVAFAKHDYTLMSGTSGRELLDVLFMAESVSTRERRPVRRGEFTVPPLGFMRVGDIVEVCPSEMEYISRCHDSLRSHGREMGVISLHARGIRHPRTGYALMTGQKLASIANRFSEILKLRESLDKEDISRSDVPDHYLKAAYCEAVECEIKENAKLS